MDPLQPDVDLVRRAARAPRKRSMPARVLVCLVLATVSGAAAEPLPREAPEGSGGARAPGGSSDTSESVPTRRGERRIVVETIRGAHSLDLETAEVRVEPRADGGPPLVRFGGDQVPLDEVLFVRFAQPPRAPGPTEVHLVNKDRVWGSIVGSAREKFTFRSPAFARDSVELEFSDLLALVARPPTGDDGTEARTERLLRGPRPATDVLELVTGASLEGILEAVGPNGLEFNSESLGENSVVFPLDKVRILRLADVDTDAAAAEPRAEEQRDGLSVAVYLVDGSTLSGKLTGLQDRTLTINHPVLGEMGVRTDWVSDVAVRGGRLRFLSDMEIARSREHLGPLFTDRAREQFRHKLDRNVLGEPMRMGGRILSKGIGVHAYSLLEYELGGGYERFQAMIGLDDAARPPPGGDPRLGGAVVFRVRLDEQVLLEAPLTYDDPPRSLDLPVEGGQVLALEVDFHESDLRVARARADWGEARVIR